MRFRSKKYRELKAKLPSEKDFTIDEALSFIKENPAAKFDETVELIVKLGVDTKKADQQVRGTVVLPHGTGKKVRVLVFAKGEKEKEALSAGADYVGSNDFIEKIKSGWLEFDACIATPDMMRDVGKLGRILGPRGLMPNPKLGTITFEVAKAVKEAKAGKIEYRANKHSIVQVPIGKLSFEKEKLFENFQTVMSALMRAKPAAAKGQYIKNVHLSYTMGLGLKLDLSDVRKAALA